MHTRPVTFSEKRTIKKLTTGGRLGNMVLILTRASLRVSPTTFSGLCPHSAPRQGPGSRAMCLPFAGVLRRWKNALQEFGSVCLPVAREACGQQKEDSWRPAHYTRSFVLQVYALDFLCRSRTWNVHSNAASKYRTSRGAY
eukprot:gb/GECG01000631.1/.p1 GENE.gb/GECG01000631.1/~~gb/GECG01000631.1/.p1  ORF type:complete len:141 (+),score=6.72 gb/GECG01000631.1/:1-423(+)